MILLFGGTTEGKMAIEVLTALQCPFVYSTKTRVSVPDGVAHRFGALDIEEMKAFAQNEDIQLIINAAHPFASALHHTIHEVAMQMDIPVIRLERTYPERTVHPLVTYVNDYDQALDHLSKHKGKTLLALSGVQSIPKLKPHWTNNQTYFRILDREESKAIAHEHQFPSEQLILGLSDGSLDAELQAIKDYEVDVILTKESGESGGLSTKIEAAKGSGVPILIIQKPELPTGFELVNDLESLKKAVSAHVLSLKTSQT